MESFNWLLENYEQIFEIAAYVIAAASIVAAFTPSPKDDEVVSKAGSWLGKIKTLVNLLAINVKNAKPKQ